ncbi:MAG: hypothetical protein IJN21_02045 [Clostridia bacterium]|nr:hypothetical protein [Clostridia bacterium]
MGIYLTKKELATVVGYTYRRLHDINMSLPDDGKLFVEGENKKYDLAIFVQRWVRYKTDQATSAEMSLDEVKAIHEQVKPKKHNSKWPACAVRWWTYRMFAVCGATLLTPCGKVLFICRVPLHRW